MNLFRQLVGLLGRRISPTQGLYLHRPTQCRKTRTHIHTSGGIRTHDPSVRTTEDSTCLRPLGHCDRFIFECLDKKKKCFVFIRTLYISYIFSRFYRPVVARHLLWHISYAGQYTSFQALDPKKKNIFLCVWQDEEGILSNVRLKIDITVCMFCTFDTALLTESPSIPNIENAWSYTSPSPYVFMAWYRDNSAFTF
jgi:hypothetical protein